MGSVIVAGRWLGACEAEQSQGEELPCGTAQGHTSLIHAGLSPLPGQSTQQTACASVCCRQGAINHCSPKGCR